MSYSIIYADPPWFRGQRMYSANKNDHHVEASRHYPVMKVEDICALNIKDIAADDCALFNDLFGQPGMFGRINDIHPAAQYCYGPPAAFDSGLALYAFLSC